MQTVLGSPRHSPSFKYNVLMQEKRILITAKTLYRGLCISFTVVWAMTLFLFLIQRDVMLQLQ